MEGLEEANKATTSKTSSTNRPLIIFLVVVFGQGSWIALNGLWVQLPLLVSLGIPEQFQIATWLVLVIQVANIGPLIFTLVNYFTPSGFHFEIATNYFITALGAIVTFLLIFLWDKQSVWGFTQSDNLHSTALILCAFFLSVVDCTSSVAFTPFMSRFKPYYVTWYFVGEGFSSLTPSIVALIQGVGGKADCVANETSIVENATHVQECTSWVPVQKSARFGPSGFFGFLFVMSFACFLSYLLLNILPQARSEQSKQSVKNGQKSNNYEMVSSSDVNHNDSDETLKQRIRPFQSLVLLFTILGVVSALNNSVLPSVQSYSAGAYGIPTYLLAATLACVTKPIASMLVLVRPKDNIGVVVAVGLVGVCAGCYSMMTALTSPFPPLQHTTIGRFLIVTAWITSSGCFSYVHATVGWILRQETQNRVLFIWFGGITQLGSLIGACTMFVIVNKTDILQPYYEDPCENAVPCEISTLP